jgi:hypothetical protein
VPDINSDHQIHGGETIVEEPEKSNLVRNADDIGSCYILYSCTIPYIIIYMSEFL